MAHCRNEEEALYQKMYSASFCVYPGEYECNICVQVFYKIEQVQKI